MKPTNFLSLLFKAWLKKKSILNAASLASEIEPDETRIELKRFIRNLTSYASGISTLQVSKPMGITGKIRLAFEQKKISAGVPPGNILLNPIFEIPFSCDLSTFNDVLTETCPDNPTIVAIPRKAIDASSGLQWRLTEFPAGLPDID
ncbi:unnamed protein product [Ceratitis capitata]|uniref:(Mediterranean fruit fly) hypothetical protein n=1 Tax=Ceratitis capitata TaxID=7213 RepID=A0A811VBZ4_CERCA|nr:unnamed protein product [Ceratitis capitata]